MIVFFAKFALNLKMLNFAVKMIKNSHKKATQSHLLFVADEFLSNKIKNLRILSLKHKTL